MKAARVSVPEVATLQAVVRAWGESLDLLQRLVQDVCPPGQKDLEGLEGLHALCCDVDAHLYMYRGQV